MTEKESIAKKKKKKKVERDPRIVHPEAAGIDIGAEEIYVAVRSDRSDKPVRRFTSFTDDLHRIGDFLSQSKVTTIAMESTGVYWIPLYEILEARGFTVCLVNARDVKHVPGRKTDVQDCQWLQTLHTHGLLRASFRPAADICAIRSIHRHREQLIETSTTYIHHIQKSLSQMNIQIHHVLSDITGVSGQAILDAILQGERDAKVLAKLRDPRVKTPVATIERSLEGNWRDEHLFTLKQSLSMYRTCQEKIRECETQLQQLTKDLENRSEQELSPEQITGKRNGKKSGGLNDASLFWEQQLYHAFGVNMLEIPGISISTALTFLSEVGTDLSRFKSVHHFCSWLRLAPQNKISGGVVLASRTPKYKPRIAIKLRIAAQTLLTFKGPLGDTYRRLKAKLGAAKAITAMAHRLARILYTMITKKQPYREEISAKNNEKRLQQRESYLRKQAKMMGFQLTPIQ